MQSHTNDGTCSSQCLPSTFRVLVTSEEMSVFCVCAICDVQYQVTCLSFSCCRLNSREVRAEVRSIRDTNSL